MLPLRQFSRTFVVGLFFVGLLLSANAFSAIKVNIEGVEDNLRENIELNLSVKRQKDIKTRTTLNRLIKKIPKEVDAALQPFGYYESAVRVSTSQDDASLLQKAFSSEDGPIWRIDVKVTPGPRVIVDTVSVILEGDDAIHETLTDIVAAVDIQPGDPLVHGKYKALKSQLLNTAYNAGYLDAEYSLAEIRVDKNNHAAYMFLTLKTGPRFYFGKINIEQDILSQKVMDRYTQRFEGEPFEADSLLNLKFALTGGGYFSNVDVDVKREESQEQQIPLDISTAPAPRFNYTGSIGWGTETGTRVGAGIVNRRVNKLGHKLKSNIRLSETEDSFVTQYKMPTGNMVSEYYDVKFNAKQEDINDLESVRYVASASHNRDFMKGSLNYGVSVVQEDFQFTGEPQRRAELLIPGATYTYVKSENPMFSRKGYSFTIDVHGGVESAFSETSFLHVSVSGNAILPLGERTRLILRGEQGRVISDDFERLPPSERFFTGGVSSVRGYGYQDIAPQNNEGVLIGGNTLVTASAELDYLFKNGWGVAVFTDAGTATNDDNYSLHKSYGVGLRYKTPIGLLRVDIAHPLDKLSGDDSDIKLHLNIGPDL